ncbi:hypothetical protein SAMN04487977_101456 [Treponema bryantii]|uniref:Uncharacterized protein n=1 Tax=Treponema bryantii TaxID=163 RepID=A0A1H9ASL7_9SPIR|nr:hypothetical protein [Treponema bryantii]SEP79746.1 hypothetical protein SAMN04487977_101456 [Treponema bryantii]
MAVDFLHPLCYRKSGTTHKIFGHTAKSELTDTSRALAVKTSDGIRYFNAVDVSATQPDLNLTGLQLSSLRDFKTTKNNIYSTVGCVRMSVTKTGFFAYYKLGLYIVGGVTFQQPLNIVGTFGSHTINQSITSSGIETPSTVSAEANITLTIDGTSYTKTIQRTFDSSVTDYIILTSSVSP